jgi:hypothetical protein
MASGGDRLLRIKVESAKNGPTGWSGVARLLTPALYVVLLTDYSFTSSTRTLLHNSYAAENLHSSCWSRHSAGV